MLQVDIDVVVIFRKDIAQRANKNALPFRAEFLWNNLRPHLCSLPGVKK